MNDDLIKSCEMEDLSTVRELIEKGAYIDHQEQNGRTPLMIAVQKNNLELAAYLMEQGADLNVRDNTMLTPWLCAGANGFHGILKKALEFSPDLKSTNRFGGTVLLPSSEKGYLKTVEVALKAGVPVNHVNDLGWSALQEAVILGNGGYLYCDIIRQLMKSGADPDLRDHDGNSSMDIARMRKQEGILAILQNREIQEQKVVDIKELIGLEEYSEALEQIHGALKGNAENPELHYLAGYVYSILSQHEESFSHFKKGSLLPGGAPEFLFYTANALRLLKRSDEALAEYEKAVALDPKEFFYRYHMSNYQRELGRHEDAVRTMDSLLEHDPKRYDYFFHKANSLRSLGRHDEAMMAMDKAMEADPSNSLYVFHKAQSLHLIGNLEEALILLKKAISMKSSQVYLNELEVVMKKLNQ